MPRLIAAPTVVAAAGTPPKRLEEYVGRVNSGHENLSIARMVSPEGWSEPGQTPDFEETSIVLRGTLRVESKRGVLDVGSGQAVVAEAGEWVRYSPKPKAQNTSRSARPHSARIASIETSSLRSSLLLNYQAQG